MLRHVMLVTVGVMLATAPAIAGARDTPLCKRDLAAVSASLHTAGAQVLQVGGARSDDACVAYRSYFIEIVKARAVMAQCMTGNERDEELGRFDNAARQANAGIAERC